MFLFLIHCQCRNSCNSFVPSFALTNFLIIISYAVILMTFRKECHLQLKLETLFSKVYSGHDVSYILRHGKKNSAKSFRCRDVAQTWLKMAQKYKKTE